LSSLPYGQDINYSGVSHPRTLQPALNNPASLTAARRNGYWFGLGNVGVGYEVGNINNLKERLDRLSDELDRDDLGFEEAETLKAELDALLVDLGRYGTLRVDANVTPPMMPLGGGLPGIGGDFAIGISALAVAKVRILDAPIEVVPVSGGDYELQSRTSGYLKAGGGVVLSLGYSGNAIFRRDGTLALGGRLNYYDLELGKAVVAIEDEDDDEGDLEDDLDRNRRSNSALGLDLGALWSARNYSLGATLRNVNEPTINYPSIGSNCDDPSLSQWGATNCFTAASFADRISLDETVTLNRQLQLEGAIHNTSRTWMLAVSQDMNSTRDLVGDEHQWRSINASYASHRWWVPGLRVGYRENLVGSELTFYTAGLTLFRVLNLDAAMSKDSVENDGDEIPRSAMLSLSLEFFY
jgi:hypothetical protein